MRADDEDRILREETRKVLREMGDNLEKAAWGIFDRDIELIRENIELKRQLAEYKDWLRVTAATLFKERHEARRNIEQLNDTLGALKDV